MLHYELLVFCSSSQTCVHKELTKCFPQFSKQVDSCNDINCNVSNQDDIFRRVSRCQINETFECVSTQAQWYINFQFKRLYRCSSTKCFFNRVPRYVITHFGPYKCSPFSRFHMKKLYKDQQAAESQASFDKCKQLVDLKAYKTFQQESKH